MVLLLLGFEMGSVRSRRMKEAVDRVVLLLCIVVVEELKTYKKRFKFCIISLKF